VTPYFKVKLTFKCSRQLTFIFLSCVQALLIESGKYPLTKVELMDCDVLYYSAERLARTFKVSNLSEVVLDYNEFGDEGCIRLCKGCRKNKVGLWYSSK